MEKSYRCLATDEYKIFDNMFEGISVYSLIFNDNGEVIDGILEYMNPVTAETMNLNPEDAIGRNAVEVFGLDFIRPHLIAINRLHSTGEKKHFEVYYVPTDRYFLVSGFDMHDNLFAVLRVDITKRKKTEKELKETRNNLEKQVKERTIELEKAYKSLKESEAKYRELFDKSTDMISLSEINEDGMPGKYIEVNEVGLKRLGYTKEEILNLSPTDIIVHDKRVEMPKNAIEMAKNGIGNFEIVHVTKEGKTIPVEIKGHIINYQERKVYLTVSRDITERKKAEEELNRHAMLLDISYEAIFSWSLENGILSWNHGAERLYGYNKEEAIGKVSHELLKTKHPIEFNKFIDILTHEKMWSGEVIHTTKQGKNIIVESRQQLIQETNGNNIVIETNRNITKRKKAEKKLNKTIKELERSNKELESFAYITSHDLQEPLRTIASFAQLIKRRYKGKLDPDADEFIDFMVDSASRMKEMILGLLDYSRVGTRGHEFTEFPAKTALNYALNNLGSAISEANAEITSDPLPVIFADEDQIIRVFQNLVGNAIKFRKEEVKPKIHISVKKKDNEYVFSVSDNGIGLEEQYSDKIFEVFKRLHAIGEYQGAGIGLAVVKRIIGRHGGRIWVESELGKGSTFYFMIPVTNK
ncbi:PAS domain S-box protein [Methanobacterium sp.]|uniref:sensor histidine kinase n=1 Tax=Methanobacterium sp. TaxID=2164 RepID=UPI003C759383